jgi:hypothetical protein
MVRMEDATPHTRRGPRLPKGPIPLVSWQTQQQRYLLNRNSNALSDMGNRRRDACAR